jgi:hypothetical protein
MIEYYIGIDGASTGAIAIIGNKLNIIDVLKYPKDNLIQMYHFLKPYAIYGHCKAAVECPFRNPMIGMEKIFQIAGQYEMLLNILNIPFIWAEPRINMKDAWQKEFNFKCLTDKEYNKELRRTKKLREALKQESINMCDLIFDGKADKWLRKPYKNSKTGKLTKPDDNISDALLLAEYRRRIC